jgi:hypothetical protein
MAIKLFYTIYIGYLSLTKVKISLLYKENNILVYLEKPSLLVINRYFLLPLIPISHALAR